MKRVRMPGIEREVGVLAMGTANLTTDAQADEIYDAYVEAGGDIFDTAHVYGRGLGEELLGRWMSKRGVRDRLVLLGKGAHTPNCRPDAVGPQLDESLGRLGTDRLDIYVLHRDDPAIPAGEFIDAMLAEREGGRIGAYGFSNWTLQRMKEATDYARRKGAALPTALSYNFSLAEMVDPVWPGVMSARDEAWRALLTGGGFGLYSWSAQARSFFTDRADTADDEMKRAWFSPANLARRQRAYDLARTRGFTANQVALAWVLHQDFPVSALIGPLTRAELEDSLGALRIDLSTADVRHLDKG
jgi:aryl-alcohol dehydrogenase-like predicted oxidoreductase